MGVGVIEHWHNSARSIAARPAAFKALKSETRNPKAEGNPKAEARRPSPQPLWQMADGPATPDDSDFGYRASFGFRVSGLGFQCLPGCSQPQGARLAGQNLGLLSIAAIGNPFAGR
jgi:hypothetical protein